MLIHGVCEGLDHFDGLGPIETAQRIGGDAQLDSPWRGLNPGRGGGHSGGAQPYNSGGAQETTAGGWHTNTPLSGTGNLPILPPVGGDRGSALPIGANRGAGKAFSPSKHKYRQDRQEEPGATRHCCMTLPGFCMAFLAILAVLVLAWRESFWLPSLFRRPPKPAFPLESIPSKNAATFRRALNFDIFNSIST